MRIFGVNWRLRHVSVWENRGGEVLGQEEDELTLRWQLICLLLVGLCLPAGASLIIADHQADYTEINPPAGWSYLWSRADNIGTGAYDVLLWNPIVGGRYAVSASGIWPWDGRYTYIRQRTMNVGWIGEFTVLAYTIQNGEGGHITFTGEFGGDDVLGSSGNSDGWDLRVYVNNTLIDRIVYGWTMDHIGLNYALGSLNEGDTVYFAMGTNNGNYWDRGTMQVVLTNTDIVIPEPGTLALVALGGVLICALRRRR
ncbi:MAG: PEP-CTERM sorting domain-containing protein [Acidobacteria bacterium]|nr:PEP-CTERM sorting domain-containing protein [Acidobacteriota bacterium]